MSEDELPPSFEPRERRERPDRGEATPVSNEGQDQRRRQRPTTPRRPARSQPADASPPDDRPQRRSILGDSAESSAPPPPAQPPPRPQRARQSPPPDGATRTMAQPPADQPLPPSYAPGSGQGPPGEYSPPQHHEYGQPQPYPGDYPPYEETGRRRRKPRWGRRIALAVVLLLVLVLAWPIGLGIWAQGRLTSTEALSGAASTPGTTYLLTGSDQRGDLIDDATSGGRADTVMVMHSPPSGTSSLVSLPRDTLVEIPGQGTNRINAAYSFGGPPLLVETVENLTGLTVDHYVEIGMDGLADVVDGVGGVELCLDYDVSDDNSNLEWTAGCHHSDGETALAFARMRYADPTGDIGRAERQRQVVGAIVSEVSEWRTVVDPRRHVELVRVGTDNATVSEGTGIIDLGRLALNFRSTTNDGYVGAPPISNPNHREAGIGSTVLLDSELIDQFWQDVTSGEIQPDDYDQAPTG